jgi:hypothetical protein
MSSTGSVTRWIDQLEVGDLAAAQPLWDRYFHRLVELARRKLGAKPRVTDGEDVALSAFDSFCRGLKDGRFRASGPRQPLEAAGRSHRAQDVPCAPR